MRVILIVCLVLVVAFGAAFGALNAAPVTIDFYFASIEVPGGIALLGCVAFGWLLGGLTAWLGPARRRRRERRAGRLEGRTAVAEREAAADRDA